MTYNHDQIMSAKGSVPEHVLFQEVGGNSALLNLDTETYYGLDDVGTSMWQAIERADTISDAARLIADEYDAPLATIEHEIAALALDLCERGLLDIAA